MIWIIGVCCLRSTAKVGDEVKSYYSPEDNIQINCEVDGGKGVVIVNVAGTQKDISLLVSKEMTSYTYRLASDEVAAIPLNMGSGDYTLDIRLYITENEGELIWSETVPVELRNDLSPFLSSSKIVNWSEEMKFVKQAEAIASGLEPGAAALAICNFVGKRLTYTDSSPAPGYIPDLEAVYAGSAGMCYDYAALYTAMCRAVGIPCKLLMGYSEYIGKGIYHAWSQVYIDGEWLTVDPTCSQIYGAVFLDASKNRIERSY